jgi:hypothetical protein
MTPDEGSIARIRRVRRDLAADIASMQEHRDRLQEHLEASDSAAECAVLAVAIHHYYTALEGALERSIRFLDGSLPEGPDWHRSLLVEASKPLPDVRPAILSAEHMDDLEQLLRFRHFFRHAYAVSLDMRKLTRNAERIARVHTGVIRDLENVRSILESATNQVGA